MCYYSAVTVVENDEVPLIVAVPKEQQPQDGIFCSCIQSARSFGADLPKGDAKDLVPNGTPAQGGVVLLTYGSVHHVAYIQALLPKGMWVQEGNKVRCTETERYIPYDDKAIRGFWHEDNV